MRWWHWPAAAGRTGTRPPSHPTAVAIRSPHLRLLGLAGGLTCIEAHSRSQADTKEAPRGCSGLPCYQASGFCLS